MHSPAPRPHPTRRDLLLASALGAGLAATALAQPSAGKPGDPRPDEGYLFSPVNQFGISLTAAHWNPIIQYVSEKSGVNLHLKLGRTSADTTSYVLAQEVDFVFSNHLFSPEREKLGWKVFGRRQMPPIHGQIVVPADSPITTLAQLKDQDVAFAGPEALVAYKFPYAHLLSLGIDVKVVFGGNQDGALAQLFSGKVKAAGGNSQLLDGFAKRENKKFRVLWTSEPLYDLALMASSKVPEKDVKAVAEAFAGMARDPQGKEILHQTSDLVKLPSDAVFIPSQGLEYAAYRRFYQNAPVSLR
jgi:phosphonate transport system substrate-binding protein